MAIKASTYIDQLKKAKTQAAANNVITTMMRDTTAGLFNIGVSAKDQAAVYEALQTYQKLYPNVDIAPVADAWKSGVNVRSNQLDTLLKNFNTVVNTPQQVLYEDTRGDTRTATVTPTDGTPSYQVQTTSRNNTPSPSGGGGGGSGIDPALQAELNRLNESNQTLQAQLEELLKPKVYSNAELAKVYGLEDLYNEANIKQSLDEATNQYFDKAIGTQQGLRTESAGYNSQWLNQMLNDYLASNQYTAPTASGKGATFANALMTQMNAGLVNAENDYGMMQSVDQLGRDRTAELATNVSTASDKYNSLGAYLQSVGADMNKSDVQAYAGQLGSLANMYATDRAYSSALAQAASTRYQGQASAAAKNAEAAATARNSAAGKLDTLWNAIYHSRNQNASYADNYVYNQLMGGTVK